MRGQSLFNGWRKTAGLISNSCTFTMQTIIQKASSSFRKSSRVAAIIPMPCKVALQVSTRRLIMRTIYVIPGSNRYQGKHGRYPGGLSEVWKQQRRRRMIMHMLMIMMMMMMMMMIMILLIVPVIPWYPDSLWPRETDISWQSAEEILLDLSGGLEAGGSWQPSN